MDSARLAEYIRNGNWGYIAVIKIEAPPKSVAVCLRTLDGDWEPFKPDPEGYSAAVLLTLPGVLAAQVRTGLGVALDLPVLERLEKGGDLYAFVASRMFEIPMDEVTVEQRHTVKEAMLRLTYARSPSLEEPGA